MSTGLIIAIIVAVLVLIALLVMLPRMRAAADRKQAERELRSRRETVATQHRAEAAERERRAELAEQKARIAQQDAERERAEANLRHEQAALHERGLADDELIDESERDRFADVTGPTTDVDGDGSTTDDVARAQPSGDSGFGTTAAGDGTAAPDDELVEPGASYDQRGRDEFEPGTSYDQRGRDGEFVDPAVSDDRPDRDDERGEWLADDGRGRERARHREV